MNGGFLPIDLHQLRLEGFRIRLLVQSLYGPVLFRLESPDFLFPFADETGSHGLHAPCRKATVNQLPQPWRQLVAHQPVQHPPGLLGIHPIHVDGAGMFDGLLDGRRRDFMESNAHMIFGIHIQKLGQMPGNRFPLAIRVRCQKDSL